MIQVSSRDNDNFKKMLSLTTSKGIRKEGLFILSGKKLIQEFIKKPTHKIEFEITHKDISPVTGDGIKVMELGKELFNEIDVVGTHFNLLVLKLPDIKTTDLTEEAKGLELILPLGDPSNLGAALRSAEAFGVKKVYLSEDAANPFLPKSVKASAGSVLRLEIVKTKKLADIVVMKSNTPMVALDNFGQNIKQFKWPKNVRLIVGEEGPGLGQQQSNIQLISIPTTGVESLNAVVATSVALYDYQIKK